MKGIKISDADKAKFIEMWESGVSSERIAMHFKIPVTLVHSRAGYFGCKRPSGYRASLADGGTYHPSVVDNPAEYEVWHKRWEALLPKMVAAVKAAAGGP